MPARKTKKTSTKKTGRTTKVSTRRTASSSRDQEEDRPVAKKKLSTMTVTALDIDRAVREEVTEWFTSNRKGLETVFRRVADQVREELELAWQDRLEEEREKAQLEIRRYAEETAALRERARNQEEEIKRMKSVLGMVRNQVSEETYE
ncbi:MAG: hypothetical protein AAF533_13025 [Acidobacteriota bacterium]